MWFVIMLIVAAMIPNAMGQTTGKQPLITIQRPVQNEVVNVRHEVSGVVSSTSSAQGPVSVIVQPQETGDCWVQTPAMVNSDGTWRATVQFGEATAAHSGKPYEIRALQKPKTALSIGKTVCWPAAEAYSDPVYVRRK